MSLGKSATNCVLPQSFQDNKRGGFPPWEKPGNGTWWFPCGVASSPVSLQLNISTGEHILSLLWCPQCPCVSEHWAGMAFQQGAISGTWVLSNNQICLWSRATALGHSAIFSAINFSIYKFLLGVVTLWTVLSPASWEQYSWAVMGITEWCLASQLSREPQADTLCTPFSTLIKGLLSFPFPFHF